MKHFDTKPKITVYIPCYNAAHYLEQCILALKQQSYAIDELLVIDDGSDDTTTTIAKKHSVNVVTHATNKGISAARNTALSAASNDLVACCDADCVADSHWLEELVHTLLSTHATGVGGRVKEKDHTTSADNWRAKHMPQHWGEHRINTPPFICGANTLFKKSVLLNIGGYNTVYRTNYEDVDMSNRLQKAGHKYVYEPHACVSHIKRDSRHSVLRSFWKWHYFVHRTVEQSKVQSTFSSIGMMGVHVDTLLQLLKKDLSDGAVSFIPLDILYFFLSCWWEITSVLTKKGETL